MRLDPRSHCRHSFQSKELKPLSMKTLLLSAFLFFSCFSGFAQTNDGRSIGDTLGPWITITFEEPSEYIQITPSPGNIWQIGPPQKSFFNQAYTIPNAIVTDTTGYYPVNNTSSFDLFITTQNTNYFYPMDLFIDFRHKFDSDTLKDGGYISVSWDLGQTWNNILDDTLSQYWLISPFDPTGFVYGNTNLYNNTDTLFNVEHGYSGKSNGWVHSCLAWYDLPVAGQDFWPPDTMILRFNFVSDNLQNNREGWMIDQIRIFSIDLGSGTGGELNSGVGAHVTPNPVRSDALVSLDKVCNHVEYCLTDLSGRTTFQGNCENGNHFVIPGQGITPGIYILKITTDHGYTDILKVVFANR